jgi:hypothetical protein
MGTVSLVISAFQQVVLMLSEHMQPVSGKENRKAAARARMDHSDDIQYCRMETVDATVDQPVSVADMHTSCH